MGSLAKEILALETTETVIARLSLALERDAIINRLIAAIEADRAALLAAMVGGRARLRKPGLDYRPRG